MLLHHSGMFNQQLLLYCQFYMEIRHDRHLRVPLSLTSKISFEFDEMTVISRSSPLHRAHFATLFRV